MMLRVLAVASLLLVIPRALAAQTPSVLHIKVTLVNAGQQVTPVPRHALLISDNPASAAPRRVVTAPDGTYDVRLRPGNYTVESDLPVAFEGQRYQWSQTLDIIAGRDAVLELTAGNAEIEPIGDPATGATPLATDLSAMLMQWQDSVVALWTPTTRASGFVVDANGLIATSQRAIGTATSIEVQLSPAIKVTGSVLVADAARDVAIVRIDPRALASTGSVPRPVPLGCTAPAKPPLLNGQMIFTVGWPLRESKGVTSGTVSRESLNMVSDFTVPRGSAGGPVFAADGSVIGIASVMDEKDERRRRDFRVVGADQACQIVANAMTKMADAGPPDGTHLPVEPGPPLPLDALKELVQRRAGSLSPYQTAATDFDVAFITPVQVYGSQYQAEQASRRERTAGTRKPEPTPTMVRPLMEFGNWSDYVADLPPVLLVRVTPKLIERFWTKVARGAAGTQGVALPPKLEIKSGFSRMRALCGAAEVTPIHPFMLEHRVPGSDAIYEGLYVFDPGSLGPECATVTLVLHSEKEPDKADTRVIDPKVIQQIWQDFIPYRAAK